MREFEISNSKYRRRVATDVLQVEEARKLGIIQVMDDDRDYNNNNDRDDDDSQQRIQ